MFFRKRSISSDLDRRYPGMSALERAYRIHLQNVIDAEKEKNDFSEASPNSSTLKYHHRIHKARVALEKFADENPSIVYELERQRERKEQFLVGAGAIDSDRDEDAQCRCRGRRRVVDRAGVSKAEEKSL
jgi:hypothetical protein